MLGDTICVEGKSKLRWRGKLWREEGQNTLFPVKGSGSVTDCPAAVAAPRLLVWRGREQAGRERGPAGREDDKGMIQRWWFNLLSHQ